MTTTIDDVRQALENLNTTNFDQGVYDDGVQVTVSESEAGQFFKNIRVHGFDADTKRLGDSLVARIDAEEETVEEKLDQLFG